MFIFTVDYMLLLFISFLLVIIVFSVQPMPFDGPAAVLLPGVSANGVEQAAEDLSYPSIFFVNVQDPLKRYVSQTRYQRPGK